MGPAFLTQGITAVRNAVKGLVTHVGVAIDQTAHDPAQTVLAPGGGTTLIKAATKVDVGADSFDATIQINGDTEFTGATIWTIGLMSGSAAGSALTRTVRAQGIGVQAGDSFTVGVRLRVEDAS
jgi:hypothetical protein